MTHMKIKKMWWGTWECTVRDVRLVKGRMAWSVEAGREMPRQ